jgi:ATP-dependent DNA ligase
MLVRYLPPAAPTLRSAPPRGEQCLHEVKFDGWRIQLHKHGRSARAFTKNGHDFSSRVRWMVDALARLKGVRSVIIDGEIVACDDAGLPDFYRLHFHRHDRDLCVWAFDLLHLNGRDLREMHNQTSSARKHASPSGILVNADPRLQAVFNCGQAHKTRHWGVGW